LLHNSPHEKEQKMTSHGVEKSSLVVDAITACRRWRRVKKVVDTSGASLTGGDVLIRALVLRRVLRRLVLKPDEQRVGVLLPPSAAGMVTNFALTLDRRVSVNLNYTLTPELINKCIAQAGLQRVLTSRKFIERVPLELNCEMVFLEDFKDVASKTDKAIGAFQAYAMPAKLLARALGHGDDGLEDPMTIMFTSGTTGDPKGAVLTYGNIGSNVNAVDNVIHIRRPDVMIGVLPFFHSFGFTVTLWSGLILDTGVAYHVNPLDAQVVGRLCRDQNGTILVATPMFLRNYGRRCEPEDFKSLEVLVTGGERLPKQVADEFEAKFDIRPIEGYGCTETSPLIASNIPASRAQQDQVDSAREGTVGQAAPGIQVKIVDQETGIDLPFGERGILLVKGANVMAGYLNDPAATTARMRDGWYVTGDLATIDDEGFIRIVGRESRFAKIGGEMVSHLAVEDPLTNIVGMDEDGQPKLIVISVPDETKGERLVVIHKPISQTPAELRRALSDSGLPNLYIPSLNSFMEVPILPFIGTGKIDLKQIREMAIRAFPAKEN